MNERYQTPNCPLVLLSNTFGTLITLATFVPLSPVPSPICATRTRAQICALVLLVFSKTFWYFDTQDKTKVEISALVHTVPHV